MTVAGLVWLEAAPNQVRAELRTLQLLRIELQLRTSEAARQIVTAVKRNTDGDFKEIPGVLAAPCYSGVCTTSCDGHQPLRCTSNVPCGPAVVQL